MDRPKLFVPKVCSAKPCSFPQYEPASHHFFSFQFQVFKSPWCSGEDIEERFREMMEDMFKLEMDDVTHVLLVAMVLFKTNPNSKIKERQMAVQSQECFVRMLYR
jgi:hypothetical protein